MHRMPKVYYLSLLTDHRKSVLLRHPFHSYLKTTNSQPSTRNAFICMIASWSRRLLGVQLLQAGTDEYIEEEEIVANSYSIDSG